MKSSKNIGIAHPAFFSSFKGHIPELELIKSPDDVKKYDLIIFSGGEDISPKIYNSRSTYSVGINEARDKKELLVLQMAASLNKKLLGVCRGHQLINAVSGSRFIQDIFHELNQYHLSYHPLMFSEDGKRKDTINKFFNSVNSLHHQGISTRGCNMHYTSYWNDVVESTESSNIITTQFHPEFMGEKSQAFFDYITKEWLKKETVDPYLSRMTEYIPSCIDNLSREFREDSFDGRAIRPPRLTFTTSGGISSSGSRIPAASYFTELSTTIAQEEPVENRTRLVDRIGLRSARLEIPPVPEEFTDYNSVKNYVLIGRTEPLESWIERIMSLKEIYEEERDTIMDINRAVHEEFSRMILSEAEHWEGHGFSGPDQARDIFNENYSD